MDITVENVTDAVIDSFALVPSTRMREVKGVVVRRLQDVVRDRPDARRVGTGHRLPPRSARIATRRVGFVLLSAILGVSTLV
jgi:hypothetical protein